MSNYLWPHGLQYTSLPCPSPSLRVCSDSCHWINDAIQPSHPHSGVWGCAFFLRREHSFPGARSTIKLTQEISLREHFWGGSLTSPFRPNLPLELMRCDWEIICTCPQFTRTMNKVRQRCLLPGSCLLASRGYKHPSPDGHVGSASLSTPMTALMFFVELPKNVAVQFVLLAGPVSQASMFSYLLAAWPFPRLEWASGGLVQDCLQAWSEVIGRSGPRVVDRVILQWQNQLCIMVISYSWGIHMLNFFHTLAYSQNRITRNSN